MIINQQNQLCYGQIVSLLGRNQKEKQSFSILMSKGFTDKSVFCANIENQTQLLNYRNSLFRILPKGDLLIHDEFEKAHGIEEKQLLEGRRDREQQIYFAMARQRQGEKIVFGSDVILMHLDSELYLCSSQSCSESSTDSYKIKLKQRLNSGQMFKILPYNNYEKIGDDIYLESPVVLMNSRTKCYLEFSLDKQIMLDKRIVKSEIYDKLLQSFKIYSVDIAQYGQRQRRLEATVSNNQSSIWEFQLYQNPPLNTNNSNISSSDDNIIESYFQQDDQYIYPYDLVQIYHDQNDGVVSINEAFEVVLNEHSSNYVPFYDIWEIDPIQAESQLLQKQWSQSQQHYFVSKNQLEMVGRNKQSEKVENVKIKHYQTGRFISQEDESCAKAINFNSEDQSQLQQEEGVLQNLKKTNLSQIPHNFKLRIVQTREQKEKSVILNEEVKGNQLICQNNVYVKIYCEDLDNQGESNKQLDILEGKPMDNQQQQRQKSDSFRITKSQSISLPFQSQPLNQKTKQEFSSILRKILAQIDMSYQQKQLGFYEAKNMHAFRVLKIERQTKKEILFIESSLELLSFFASSLQVEKEALVDALSVQMIKKVTKVLKKLIVFLLDCHQRDIFTTLNQPIKRRQNQIVDMKLHTIVSEMLCILQHHSETFRQIFSHNHFILQQLYQVFIISYRFIEKLVRKNQYAKVKVSAYLQLFLMQSLFIDDEQVRSCLQEIFKENVEAVQKFITEEIIQNLVATILKKPPQEIYAKVLSLICVCGDKAIANNQNLVIQYFFTQGKDDFQFSFKQVAGVVHTRNILLNEALKSLKQNDELLIKKKLVLNEQESAEASQIKEEGWISIQELFDLTHQGTHKGNGEHGDSNHFDILYNYLLEYLHLLANLCKDRNKLGKELTDRVISFEIALCAIKDQGLSGTGSRAVFGRIMHYAYIDQPPLQLISIINNIQIWEEVEKDEYLVRSKCEISEPVKSIWQISVNVVNKFPGFYSENVHINYSRNLELLVFLQLIKTFLKQGMLSSIDQVTGIATGLLQILSYRNEIGDDKNLIADIWKKFNERDNNNKYQQMLENLHEIQQSSRQKQKQLRILTLTQNDQAISIIKTYNNNRPEATLILSCKFIVTTIIEIIMDIETNKAVFTTIKLFKQIMQDPKFNEQMLFSNEVINKFKSAAQDRPILQIVDKKKLSVDLTFTELSIFYDNPALMNQGQKLLNRLYSMRKESLQQLEKINLVVGEIGISIIKRLNVVLQKVVILKNKNILAITAKNQSQYQYNLFNEVNDSNDFQQSGIIQDLYFLGTSIRKNFYSNKQNLIQIQQPSYNSWNSLDILLPVRSEYEELNIAVQYLFMSQRIHKNLIKFIKMMQNIDTLDELLRKTLHAVYFYLTRLIIDFNINKQEFVDDREIFFDHLICNVGCAEFIRELYLNQKQLLAGEKDINFAVQKILSACVNIDIEKYYKAVLFDVLRSFIVLGDKVMKSVQTILLNTLQQKQYCDLLMFQNQSFIGNKIIPFEQILKWIDESTVVQKETLSSNSNNSINLSPQISFFVSYVSVFSLLVGNQNDATQSVCQKMHPFPYVMNLLNNSRNSIIVKRTLRSYLNGLYYTESNIEMYFEQIINEDLDNLINDLEEFKQLAADPERLAIVQQIFIMNSVRYQKLYTYYRLNIIDVQISLNLLLTKTQFIEKLTRILKTPSEENNELPQYAVHLKIVSLFTNLCKLIEHFQVQQHKQFTYQLAKRLMQIILTCSNDNKTLMETIRQQIISQCPQFFIELNELRQDLKLQFADLQPSDEDLQIQQEKQAQRLKKIQEEESKMQHIQINYFLKKLIKYFNTNRDLRKYREEESITMSIKMSELNIHAMHFYQLSDDSQFSLVSEQKYIQTLVQANINSAENFPQDLRLTFLNILIHKVINKNKHFNLIDPNAKIDEWRTDQWIKSRDAIYQQQIELKNCFAVQLVCSILTESNIEYKYQVVKLGFRLGIALLLGGNTEVQNEFLRIFKQDTNNAIIERIIFLIKQFSKLIRKRSRLDNSLQRQMEFSNENAIYLDNYDTYNALTDTMEKKTVNQDLQDDLATKGNTGNAISSFLEQVLRNAFKFVQLLCENNNIIMKQYLSQQTMADGTIKHNSIDFMQETNIIIRKFLQLLNSNISEILKYITQFLIEITQFPCVPNQLSICKSTFFDDICATSFRINDIGKQTNNRRRLSFTGLDNNIFQANSQQQAGKDFSKIGNNKIGSMENSKIFSKKFLQDMNQYFLNSLEIINNMLESEDEKVIELLANKIDQSFLIRCFICLLNKIGGKNLQQFKTMLQYQEAILDYNYVLTIIIVKLRNKFYQHDHRVWVMMFDEQISQFKSSEYQLPQIIEFIQTCLIRQLEISFNGKILTVQFPNHIVLGMLAKSTRDNILLQVTRTTHRDKIIGLFNFRQKIFKEIDHNFRLSKLSIPLTTENIDLWKRITILLSLVLNIFIIAFAKYTIVQGAAFLHFSEIEMLIIQILSVMQLEASLVLLVIFTINKKPLTEIQDNGQNLIIKKQPFKFVYNFYLLCKSYALFIARDDDFIYLLFFVAVAVLGTFYSLTYFALQLPYVIGRFSFIKEVYDSVYNAIFSRLRLLILVFILGLTYIFIFSIVIFENYVTQVYPGSSNEASCSTIYSCMLQFILSGSLGSYKSSTNTTIIIFDTIYQIFFIMLFLNIITGILLDTFAQTREARNAIEFDSQNKCYICGMEKNEIEKQNEQVINHFMKRHYLWNYAYLVYCIEKKQITDYTGMDYWIKSLIVNDDISWVPMLGQSDDALLQKFDEVNKNIDDKTVILAERMDKILINQMKQEKSNIKL